MDSRVRALYIVNFMVASAGSYLLPRQCAFAEGFGDELPFVFVNYVARTVSSDFFHINAVSFEDSNHFPDTGNVLAGAGLEPADAKPKFVAPEGSWPVQILAEPVLYLAKFVGVGTPDVSPLNS